MAEDDDTAEDDNNQDDDDDEDEDADKDADEDEDNQDDNDMPKTAAAAKKPPVKKAGKKTMGDVLEVDPTPTKKQRSKPPTRFSVDAARCFTVNPYVVGGKNKIDIVLHEGGSPP